MKITQISRIVLNLTGIIVMRVLEVSAQMERRPIVISNTSFPQMLPPQQYADVIAAVRDHYHMRCVHLVYKTNLFWEPRRDIVKETYFKQVQILLNEKAIPTAIISTYNAYDVSRYMCSVRILQVLLYMDEGNRILLELEFKEKEMTRQPVRGLNFLWLVFTSIGEMDYELNNVTVNMRREMIVAHHDGHKNLLYEVYHIEKKTMGLMVKLILEVDGQGKMITLSKSYVKRRSNLQGFEMLAYTIKNPPYTLVIENNGSVQVKGLMGKVWSLLQDMMNFTTRVALVDESRFGFYLTMSEYTQVESSYNNFSHFTDVLLFDIPTNTFQGLNEFFYGIHIPLAIFTSESRVYIKHPGLVDKTPGKVSAPFEPSMWGATVVAVFILSATLALFQHGLVLQEYKSTNQERFYDTFFTIGGLFCAQVEWDEELQVIQSPAEEGSIRMPVVETAEDQRQPSYQLGIRGIE
uniref:Uncharacterized protein n=1 Tax=Timema cristinae TaxID=61476 RepID=A0A7R9D1I8_TIMCR|nr:unnamed protein product [Timema cristinae]